MRVFIVIGGPNHEAGPLSPSTRAEVASGGDATAPSADRGPREWLADLQLAGPGRFAAMWEGEA